VEVVEVPEPTAPLLPAEWQLFADDGLYPEALASVERQGGFDAVLSAATAEQLMLLVDVARATGQRARAILALRRVVSQHGSDPNAPVAAWMLGNELAKAGDPDGAAQAFAMYRALSPQGDFAEDALARLFEGAVEQGNLEHARRLAEQYANDFPDGPRGEDIRAGLAELEQRRTRRAGDSTAQREIEDAVGAPAEPSQAASSDPGE
jgi:predicted Zn-dependent protease